jgi:hypothetical protein
MPESTDATQPSLADLLLALREVMADERRAVASLDLAALESSTARKHVLCDALTAAVRRGGTPDRETARLIARVRVELGANAALVAAAREAVQAALGIQRDDRYGRSARFNQPQQTTGSIRVVAY